MIDGPSSSRERRRAPGTLPVRGERQSSAPRPVLRDLDLADLAGDLVRGIAEGAVSTKGNLKTATRSEIHRDGGRIGQRDVGQRVVELLNRRYVGVVRAGANLGDRVLGH